MTLRLTSGPHRRTYGTTRLIRPEEARAAFIALSVAVRPVYVRETDYGFLVTNNVTRYRLTSGCVALAGYFDSSVEFDDFYDAIDAAAWEASKMGGRE